MEVDSQGFCVLKESPKQVGMGPVPCALSWGLRIQVPGPWTSCTGWSPSHAKYGSTSPAQRCPLHWPSGFGCLCNLSEAWETLALRTRLGAANREITAPLNIFYVWRLVPNNWEKVFWLLPGSGLSWICFTWMSLLEWVIPSLPWEGFFDFLLLTRTDIAFL